MKREIIIKQENADKIKAAIIEAEGRATARTITAQQVITRSQEIVEHLGISKAALEGTTASIDEGAVTFPNAYKYVPYSTQYDMRYHRGSWRLTDVYRAATSAPTYRVYLRLSETAKAAVLDKVSHYSE